MKKFLTAIVFLIFTGAGFAQCINVQTTAIKGNCYQDNQIKVTAQDMYSNCIFNLHRGGIRSMY